MSKITTTFIEPVTPTSPFLGRKYTLTHSDETGELFLTVGPDYDFSSPIELLKDGVYAEWLNDAEDSLGVFVWVGNDSYETAKKRYDVFVEMLPLALFSIFNGDRAFLDNYPQLLESPIVVKFDSIYPEFNKIVNLGQVKDYLTLKQPFV